MHASRNIQLCTKDCVCLFICPTGATNTEDGQIDASKCLDGCRLCVDACPSGAIYLVSSTYPAPQPKREEVVHTLSALARSKGEQENIAKTLREKSDDPSLRQICSAVEISSRVMAEDLHRERGYIIAQCEKTRELLTAMLEEHGSHAEFPADAVARLLELI